MIYHDNNKNHDNNHDNNHFNNNNNHHLHHYNHSNIIKLYSTRIIKMKQ